MEQIEKNFITSYKSLLAKEGKEICEEIESKFDVNDDLMKEKANTYCHFIFSLKKEDVDPKLLERCNNYFDNLNNFNRYNLTFIHVKNDREEKEKWLDMRNMRLTGL